MLARARARIVPPMNRDGRVVMAAAALRSLDYGFLSVFLGVYVVVLGFSELEAGLVFSAIMAGGSLSNAIASWRGDSIGRRRMLVVMAVLMGFGGVMYALTSSVAAMMAISVFAMTTSTGGDRTAFLSLDMAVLAQTAQDRHRTTLFTLYNVVGRGTKAIGALMIASPVVIQAWFGLDEVASFKAMFWAYAVVAFAGVAVYSLLTPNAEAVPSTRPTNDQPENDDLGPGSARSTMWRLAALFSLDAFGGGLKVSAFLSFWFTTKFDLSIETIAAVFFVGQMLNIISLLSATPLANRIGLVATMVFTQAVANVVMILMALSGNLWMAITFFMMRELTNEMDIPTRQSYSMAIVPPEARTATAGVTNLGRTLAQTITPGVAGLIAQTVTLGAPIILGSVIKLVYNGLLYGMFGNVKAPEEE
ncbi:MAG: MFS transporter [SAR202 cluster bacterium]|nr:MFS transporter [SAR202 cluster bacterium]HJO82900.1 MFS transporter [SAR202 cluster bacterium]